MTKREKQFVLTGMLFGMVVAAVLFIASRRIHDSGTADLNVIVPAQAQDSKPATSKESESANGQTVSTVQLTEQEQQQIGVQTVKVERRNLRRTLSAVA